jgi:menaquinone-9 beta-reductase
MDTCDVLVVGGGPAGSACARALVRAGLDVVVVDSAVFPRDKVCAGWITPQVVTELDLDVDEYRHRRTFQPITGFRVGLIGGRGETDALYGRPVSFGIRRCEFDHYLLQRCGARLSTGTPVTRIRKAGSYWTLNDTIRAPLLVGAGGQFCPVARLINGPLNAAPLVVAQEAELPVEAGEMPSTAIAAEVPELYFCRDLQGYGWVVRKGAYVNVGLGRLDRRSLPAATAQFLAFLIEKKKIAARVAWPWRGHAYALYDPRHRRAVDAGVMLVGDAAGLAYSGSGEGIRPAIESGLLAARTIVEANGRYTTGDLQPYRQRLDARFAPGRLGRAFSGLLPAGLGMMLGRHLLAVPAFVRHVVVDRWFLHRYDAALGTNS